MPLPLAHPPLRVRDSIHIECSRRIADAPRAFALWHLTSLDAPTVAVTWLWGFAWVAHLHVDWPVPVLLAAVTWSIYVFDRLFDARAGLQLTGPTALRDRHYFHWRHRRVLFPLALAAACAAAGLALKFLPPAARERGTAVAAAAFVYFSGVHARRKMDRIKALLPKMPASKELLVGVLFAAGCLLPAWPSLHSSPGRDSSIWLFWIPGIYFAALVWLNCSSIARWESGPIEPAGGNGRSGGLTSSESGTIETAVSVALYGMLLAFVASASNLRSAELIAAGSASALLLALLNRLRPNLTPLALRTAADLSMLTPLLLLLR